MKTYNVYQFYNQNGEIIYIGKTKRQMGQRMNEHFGSFGHLSKDLLKQVVCIKYYAFLNERDMDLAEAYLIKKHDNLINTKREKISRNDIIYIKNKIEKEQLNIFGGQEIWLQYSQGQQKQKATIIKRMYLRLKNTLKDLI